MSDQLSNLLNREIERLSNKLKHVNGKIQQHAEAKATIASCKATSARLTAECSTSGAAWRNVRERHQQAEAALSYDIDDLMAQSIQLCVDIEKLRAELYQRSRLRRKHKEPPLSATLVGQRIRTLRQRKAMSQGALAKRAGLSLSLVHDIETGAQSARVAHLQWIAGALGVTVADLFTGEVDPPRRSDAIAPEPQYGDWQVLGPGANGRLQCRCKCGLVKDVFYHSLKVGKTSRCAKCAAARREAQRVSA